MVIISAMAIVCSGCVTYIGIDGPYEGKVIDSQTKQPIEGAVVHGTWSKRHLTVAGPKGEYYDSYEVLTDKNGEFKIPGQGLLVLSNMEEMQVNVFKAGYEQYSNWWSVTEGVKGVTRQGNKLVFDLRRMTMEERKMRGVDLPLSEPSEKQRLLRIEYNKEMIESGRTSVPVFPVE
jgi:hypothetical protein